MFFFDFFKRVRKYTRYLQNVEAKPDVCQTCSQ